MEEEEKIMLRDNEKIAIQMRHGLSPYKTKSTFVEISKNLFNSLTRENGLSSNQTRTTYLKGLRKLRHPSRFNYEFLHSLFGDDYIKLTGVVADVLPDKEEDESIDEPVEVVCDMQKEFLDTEICHADLTVRTSNCLRAENLETLRDVLKCPEELLIRTPNLGRKSLEELKHYLRLNGYELPKTREQCGHASLDKDRKCDWCKKYVPEESKELYPIDNKNDDGELRAAQWFLKSLDTNMKVYINRGVESFQKQARISLETIRNQSEECTKVLRTLNQNEEKLMHYNTALKEECNKLAKIMEDVRGLYKETLKIKSDIESINSGLTEEYVLKADDKFREHIKNVVASTVHTVLSNYPLYTTESIKRLMADKGMFILTKGEVHEHVREILEKNGVIWR